MRDTRSLFVPGQRYPQSAAGPRGFPESRWTGRVRGDVPESSRREAAPPIRARVRVVRRVVGERRLCGVRVGATLDPAVALPAESWW